MSLENECEDNKADIAIIGLSIRLLMALIPFPSSGKQS